MAEIIRANFDEIESDITSREVSVADVANYLEAERSEHFQAFLDETAEQARTRLTLNPGDAKAARALEAVEHARANPPFEPFKLGSFNSALHLVRKERRAAGTYHHRRPARSSDRRSVVSDVAELKDFAMSGATATGRAVRAGTPSAPSSRQQAKSAADRKLAREAVDNGKLEAMAAPAGEQPAPVDSAPPSQGSVDPGSGLSMPLSTVEQQAMPSEPELAAAVASDPARPASSPEGGTSEASNPPGASPLQVEIPGRRGPVIATFIE